MHQKREALLAKTQTVHEPEKKTLSEERRQLPGLAGEGKPSQASRNQSMRKKGNRLSPTAIDESLKRRVREGEEKAQKKSNLGRRLRDKWRKSKLRPEGARRRYCIGGK